MIDVRHIGFHGLPAMDMYGVNEVGDS